MSVKDCPLCDFSTTENFKTRIAIATIPAACNGDQLVRHICPNCDLLFGTQEVLNMDNEQTAEFNFSRYSKAAYEVREVNNLRHMGLLRRLGLKPRTRVLNWGSGPAARLAEKASSELGLVFENFDPYIHEGTVGVLSEYEQLGEYDVILSTDVIEHLTKPIEALNGIKKYLKPDGKMIHHTECYTYRHAYSKMHVFYFFGRSLGVLATKIGMNVKLTDRDTAVFKMLQ